jgi:hypothetical protein
MGVMLAALLYVVLFYRTPDAGIATPLPPEPMQIELPALDHGILALARDGMREDRVVVEEQPLKHLLEKSIDVVESVAEALGMPEQPVPLAALRADRQQYRGRWLWYKGTLEELSTAKPGHPLRSYDIYDARLRLPDGDVVLCAFSLPVAADVRVGEYVRAEGFLMKLRDMTFPIEVRDAPMLVGRQLVRDYADWPPVTALDRGLLDGVRDGSQIDGRYQPADEAYRPLDHEQKPPLWHLAAYVRERTPKMSAAEWRQIPAMNAQAVWDRIKNGELAAGTPLRILGTLVQVRTIKAGPNPAGIRHWTEAWVQVRDLGGKTIPIWIPDRVPDLRMQTGLEVRGHYFRRFAYVGHKGDEWWTALFVAAGLDVYRVNLQLMSRETALIVFGAVVSLILLLGWSLRRDRRESEQYAAALLARRRKRRAKNTGAGTAGSRTTPEAANDQRLAAEPAGGQGEAPA